MDRQARRGQRAARRIQQRPDSRRQLRPPLRRRAAAEREVNPLPIRPLESRDIESILAIQSACPEIAQWKSADYERVAQNEMSGWIFETVAEPRAAEQKSGTHRVENSREPSVGAEPDFGGHPEERSGEGPLFDVRNTQAADDQQHRPASAINAPDIAGFLVARHVAHEIEVLNFAIRP